MEEARARGVRRGGCERGQVSDGMRERGDDGECLTLGTKEHSTRIKGK